MATAPIEICGRKVGDGYPTFVIAEAGINHNGDMETARKLVRAGKDAGVDAVKFQTFTAASLMTKTAGSAAHLDAGAGTEDVYSFIQRVSLDRAAHQMLQAECRAAGVEFLSTPMSPADADLLNELGVQAFKVASMDLDNLPLLTYLSQFGKPMILSTGMGVLGEIEAALNAISRGGSAPVVLLHCTSQYPTRPEDVNLRAMDLLRETFDTLVGYSDHTMGTAVPVAAVARGACIIEKHFTLDRSMPGPDQTLSGEPEEFAQMIAAFRTIETALGSRVKKPVEGELSLKPHFRRSIVSACDIAEGAVITADMLTFKRPGTGIPPTALDWVVGRTARNAIAADSVIAKDQLV